MHCDVVMSQLCNQKSVESADFVVISMFGRAALSYFNFSDITVLYRSKRLLTGHVCHDWGRNWHCDQAS